MLLHIWMDCGCIVGSTRPAQARCQQHPRALPVGALEDLAETDSPHPTEGTMPEGPDGNQMEPAAHLEGQGSEDPGGVLGFTRRWLASRNVSPAVANVARFEVLEPEDGKSPDENRQTAAGRGRIGTETEGEPR